MTKTSGLVKRWRESFRAVSAQRRSAVNGSQTRSEEWSWCSVVAPPCPPPALMWLWMGWHCLESPAHAHTQNLAQAAGLGSCQPGRTQFKECFKVYTPLSNWWRSCISLPAFNSGLSSGSLWRLSFFKAALTIPFLSVMPEKLLPLIIPGSGSKQAAPFPFSITRWIFSTHIKKGEKNKEASWAYHVLNAALCCCIKITPRIWLQPTKARNIKLKLQCSFLSAPLWEGIVALLKTLGHFSIPMGDDT